MCSGPALVGDEAQAPLLAPKANVRRDGQWREIEAAGLVPGDRINLKVCYYYDYYLYY